MGSPIELSPDTLAYFDFLCSETPRLFSFQFQSEGSTGALGMPSVEVLGRLGIVRFFILNWPKAIKESVTRNRFLVTRTP